MILERTHYFNFYKRYTRNYWYLILEVLGNGINTIFTSRNIR